MKLFFIFITHQKKKYLKPVELVIKQLCSKGIYDHVEGGIARYTVDEDWIIPTLRKCSMIILNLFYCFQNTVK